jgi:hypothetical protein
MGSTVSKKRKDMTFKTRRQNFLQGISLDLESHSGHVENEQGFVQKVKLVLLCKNTADAHEEMD